MGYLGSIKVDGNQIFTEKKFTSENCLHYGIAYTRQLWCELDVESIQEVLSNIYKYDETYSKTEATLLLIFSYISQLKEVLNFRYSWDKAGNLEKCELVATNDYKNTYQLKKIIIRKDGSKDYLKDYFASSESDFVDIFGDKLGKYLFSDFINRNNVYSKEWIIELIEHLSNQVEVKTSTWVNNRINTQSICQLLLNVLDKINNGDTIKIRFAPTKRGILQVASKNDGSITNHEVKDEFYFYDLFHKNKMGSLFVDVKITTKEELGWLIYAFDYMKPKQRSSFLESCFKDKYNQMSNTDTTNIVIDASY